MVPITNPINLQTFWFLLVALSRLLAIVGINLELLFNFFRRLLLLFCHGLRVTRVMRSIDADKVYRFFGPLNLGRSVSLPEGIRRSRS